MDNIAGKKSSLTWAVNITVILLVIIWLIPTVGLLVSSFRDRDQIANSAWWESAFPVEQAFRARAEGTFDARGTLGVAKDAPVGLTDIRMTFDLDTDAEPATVERLVSLTERYCVIFQTLKSPPGITLEVQTAQPAGG